MSFLFSFLLLPIGSLALACRPILTVSGIVLFVVWTAATANPGIFDPVFASSLGYLCGGCFACRYLLDKLYTRL